MDNSQLINENKKLENKIDKLKQRKFIAVEKFRVLSYYIYIYDWGLNKNQRIGCFQLTMALEDYCNGVFSNRLCTEQDVLF